MGIDPLTLSTADVEIFMSTHRGGKDDETFVLAAKISDHVYQKMHPSPPPDNHPPFRRYHASYPPPPRLDLSPLSCVFDRCCRRTPPSPCSANQMEDEGWLEQHPRYGLSAPASEKEKLDADKLELMLGILEMATGQADPIPLPQAETLFVSKLGMIKVSPATCCWFSTSDYFSQPPPPLAQPVSPWKALAL